MKKYTQTISVFALLIGGVASAAQGNGGMSECISLGVQASLDAFSKSYGLTEVPDVQVTRDSISASNGIDLLVVVNRRTTYKVIASPTAGSMRTLQGCTDAQVTGEE